MAKTGSNRNRTSMNRRIKPKKSVGRLSEGSSRASAALSRIGGRRRPQGNGDTSRSRSQGSTPTRTTASATRRRTATRTTRRR